MVCLNNHVNLQEPCGDERVAIVVATEVDCGGSGADSGGIRVTGSGGCHRPLAALSTRLYTYYCQLTSIAV
ncbi:hypothetical protein J6590_011436 [Homalodisca vitripennis]|nr:hypothetical protein J6590_011436 [Homalodisca vitripennis]